MKATRASRRGLFPTTVSFFYGSDVIKWSSVTWEEVLKWPIFVTSLIHAWFNRGHFCQHWKRPVYGKVEWRASFLILVAVVRKNINFVCFASPCIRIRITLLHWPNNTSLEQSGVQRLIIKCFNSEIIVSAETPHRSNRRWRFSFLLVSFWWPNYNNFSRSVKQKLSYWKNNSAKLETLVFHVSFTA